MYTSRKIFVHQGRDSNVGKTCVGDEEAHRIVMLASHLTRLCDIRLDICNLYKAGLHTKRHVLSAEIHSFIDVFL